MNEQYLAYSEQLTERAESSPSASLAAGIVDSLLHPLALVIRKVLTRPGRQELGLFLIDDEENILQVLTAGVRCIRFIFPVMKNSLQTCCRSCLQVWAFMKSPGGPARNCLKK